MTKMTILYSSAAIHSGIKELFGQPSPGDRRVGLIAYVGGDGGAYLPHPDDLYLICSPSPGGTDPDTLRELMRRGASVEFSDGLHMKVYWSSTRGCIITSANASSNALGAGDLKEAGVRLPPGVVNIDKLIKYAHPREILPSDLRKLDRLTKKLAKNIGRLDGAKTQPRDFLDWYSLPSKSVWKIIATSEKVSGNPNAAKEYAISEYGVKKPYSWVNVREGRIRPNDWVLDYFVTEQKVKSVTWMYADFVVKGTPKERRFYERTSPYHVVQVHLPRRYPLPPFRITSEFRAAFGKAVKQYSPKRDMEAKSNIVPARFLDLIAKEMKSK